MIIHDKELPVTTNVLYQVLFLWRRGKIAKFQTMGDFHARMNFYSNRDDVNAFCRLQGRRIYEACRELDLYFASEIICRCNDYVPRYMWDYRTPLIPYTIPRTTDNWVPPLTFSRGPLSCNLDETHLTQGGDAYTKEDIGETVNEESPKEEEQLARDLIHHVVAYHPYADIRTCTLEEA